VKAANWLTHLRHDWESIVWEHWLRELSARFQLLHYDERGSGMSDWDAEDLSFEAWVRDLETVVDEAGLDTFALLGISQGGAVAVTYAVRHPERVSHLVLYGSFPQGRTARARTAQERRESEMMLDVVESGWGNSSSSFRQVFASQFMPEGTPEQWDAFDAHQRATASPQNARRLFEVSALIDVVDVAPSVRTPTLVLHSVHDRRAPFDQGELMAALIPGAQFVPLESFNHLLLDHEPAWTRFLAELDAFVG
jgi:pimeloyl-ACP methyl ester carboxylesterase